MIKGKDILNVLEKDFNLSYIMKETVLSIPPITYFFYSYFDADKETLAVSFPANSVWQIISTFTNRWTKLEEASFSSMNLT